MSTHVPATEKSTFSESEEQGFEHQGTLAMAPPAFSITAGDAGDGNDQHNGPLQLSEDEDGEQALLTRLQEQVGFFTTNQTAMVLIVQQATGDELSEARGDSEVRTLLEDQLSPLQMLDAAEILYPGNLYPYYLAALNGENGFFNTDEDGIFSLMLRVPSSDRRRLFEENRHLFNDLKGFNQDDSQVEQDSEFGRVRRLCLGTEADGLQAAMEYATDGAGTADDLLAEVVAETGSAAQEEQRIRTELDAEGTTPERITELEARLAELGGIQNNLLSNGDEAGSFLELMQGDLSRSDFENLIAQLGMEDFARAKMIILNSLGIFDNEEAVYRAFESVPDAQVRRSLMEDPEIVAALAQHFNAEESTTASEFAAENNTLAIAIHKIENTEGWFNWDWDELFTLLQDLSPADLETLKTDYSLHLSRIRIEASEVAQRALDDILEDGHLSTDMAMEFATERRGNREVLMSTLERMPNEERFQLRVGYALNNGHSIPEEVMESGTQDAARAAYDRFIEQLSAIPNESDLSSAMNSLLGTVTAEEYDMAGGNELIAFIYSQRVEDRANTDHGLLDLSLLYSEASGSEDVAESAFVRHYEEAMADGTITEEERNILMSLGATHEEQFDNHVDAINAASELASTVASVAVGIVVTVLTGGLAGPIMAAALSGAVYVGGRELTAGDHYDLQEDGGRDALLSGVDILTGGVTSKLASRLVGSLARARGLAGRPLARALTREATEAAAEATVDRTTRIAADTIEGVAEGFISGAVGEIAATLLDESAYNQSLQDTFIQLGEAALRGGGTGAVTGGISNVVSSTYSTRGALDGTGDGTSNRTDGPEVTPEVETPANDLDTSPEVHPDIDTPNQPAIPTTEISSTSPTSLEEANLRWPTEEGYEWRNNGDTFYIRRTSESVGPQMRFDPSANNGAGGIVEVSARPVNRDIVSPELNEAGTGFIDDNLELEYQAYRQRKLTEIANDPDGNRRGPLGREAWFNRRQQINQNRLNGENFSQSQPVREHLSNIANADDVIDEVSLDILVSDPPPVYTRVRADKLVRRGNVWYIYEVKFSQNHQITPDNIAEHLTANQLEAYPILRDRSLFARPVGANGDQVDFRRPDGSINLGSPVTIVVNQLDDPNMPAGSDETIIREFQH